MKPSLACRSPRTNIMDPTQLRMIFVTHVQETGNDLLIYADRPLIIALFVLEPPISIFFVTKKIEIWPKVNEVDGCLYSPVVLCYDFNKGLVSKRTECW